MARQTRWVTDTSTGHAQRMADRFRQMAAAGHDLAGEARTLDAIIAPGSTVLDAGCGSGRVGAALAQRGHTVVGIDADATLIEAARQDYPDIEWIVGDLAEFDLRVQGQPRLFDAAILAGNVMLYLAPDTEAEVLRRVGAHVRPDGPVVVGFGTGRGYALTDFDAHAAEAGLIVDQRFATWDLRPWHADSDFAVTVLRRPAA
ncbi:class I SAM-dependent methyltransferase [Catellatospora sichuanensis]|uniref:class I SAM-dependent methyltransferase n=1 Tax=Catellatospora sichuanensis TaxID=1969805 RepID=UPI001181D745|nr:class I SAM-dependent methyltransferase [Catellatospora sichuanensis]